jgi:hypothetical protein
MEISPCRKGHTEPRNRFGQCVVCLRESRAAYKKSHATKQRTRIAPPAVATSTTRDAPPIPRSFLAVAREYLQSQDDVAPATIKKRNFILEQLNTLHDVPIAELTTPRIVAALKVIESEKDRRETAHRCAMLAGQVTRYALNHGYVAHNVLPSGQLRGTLKPVKTDSHAAIIEPQRFGTLLKYIDLYCEFAHAPAR